MENRANILRAMQICRFCLNEEGPLTNIYERQGKDNKQTVPLPLQLMACVAIEVFENDGMPQLICKTCRAQALQSYTFKTNCKKADDALKVFLATGSLTRPWSQEELNEQTKTFQATKRVVDQAEENRNKKIKRENSDVITLNYSASLSHDSNTEESNFNEGSVEGPSFASTESEEQNDQSMENDDFMNLEEESVLNPVLKVNQVKTDCFPCPHCERSFPLKQLLDLHQSNHDRERNYNCNSCEKAFFTKYDLSKHLLIHTGSKPFTCVVCEKTFARESLLHRHEKIHVNVPKYLCSQCDRTFLTGEDLDAHTAKHKKKRPFMCKICSKSFVFKQGLERHEQTHNNVKPHKCNYCEASFTSAIKLTRHVTSHAGLRPYPCKMCGRTFLLSHHLTRHMRSHYAAQQSEACVPSIGQYKCDVCSMSFRRKDSLINHSAIHSMVNLKCVICNTEFDNVVKVKEHITTHLSDLPFPCEKCDYSFETQEQLEDHELKHAEMEYEEQIEQEVLAEARQAAAVKDSNDEENSDYSGDDIAEFTITNDMENPEVVRRSKRASKIKNYAEFLKDELGSEIEDNAEGQEELPEGENTGDEAPNPEETHEEAIKPIVRSEGTKVYSRKSLPERPKVAPQLSLDQGNVAPLSKITQPHTINSLEHLSKDLSKIPDKEVFNMKIGDKTVTVQKLLLTKEQMKAMAKEGKIEKKGNTLLLKKTASQSFQSVSLDSIFGKSELKTPKKTYQRKMDLVLVLVLGLLVHAGGATDPEIEDEELRARDFLQFLNKKNEESSNRLVLAEWAYASNITEQNLQNKLAVSAEVAKEHKKDWEEVTKFNWNTFSDPDLKRQFKKYSKLGSDALPEAKLNRYQKIISEMEKIYSTAKICDFHNSSKCDLSLEPHLTQILATSRNEEELRHVWVEWRNAVGPHCKVLFEEYVDLANEAARLNNFTNNAENWLDNYEDAQFRGQIEGLWEQLKPLYLQIHAYVRFKLREKYGEVVSEKGPIPAHLLGNMWAQKWRTVSEFTLPYPDKKDEDITSELKKQNYSAVKIFQTAEDFFKSINLTEMPETFWERSILTKPNDREIVCHASAWDFYDRKDFRIKQCTQTTLEHFITAHHEMGHVEYFIQYKNQPIPFREGANSGFHEAVGDLIALSVESRKHLRKLGLLKSEKDDPENVLNNLFQIGLDKIVFLPFGYLMDLWRWDVFEGKITPDEYNCKWWELREKYQGVEPPLNRSEGDFDPAAKYHIVASVPYIRYFVSFVVQFQFHKALCEKAGQYDPNDPSKPLHECDIYQSTEAGNALKKMLQLGSSKPWHEAMELLTGHKTMDASAILEYFKPLQKWLENENQKNGAFIGWEKSTKVCVNSQKGEKPKSK